MPPQSLTWLDGDAASALPLPDRGLDFGDGLFETLLVRQGEPLYPELHMQRLQQGLQVLGIPNCLDVARQHLASAAADIGQKQWQWTALRLSVLRGRGLRGYAPDTSATPRILLTATQLNRDCAQQATAARLGISSIRLAGQPALAGIKHLNRLEQVLAAAEGQAQSVEESLMLDGAGQLASVIAGNFFLVRGDEIFTPQLADCGVLGTRRRLVIQRWAPALGMTVHEVPLTVADLETADEVFYSNSLYTVRPIAQIDGQSWETHPVSEALFNCFRDELSC